MNIENKRRSYIQVFRNEAGETVDASLILRQQVSEIRDQISQIREEIRSGLIQPLIQRRLQRVQGFLSAFTQQSQKGAEKEDETVKCPNCGAEMPKQAKYCAECGSLLKSEEKWVYRGRIQLRR